MAMALFDVPGWNLGLVRPGEPGPKAATEGRAKGRAPSTAKMNSDVDGGGRNRTPSRSGRRRAPLAAAPGRPANKRGRDVEENGVPDRGRKDRRKRRKKGEEEEEEAAEKKETEGDGAEQAAAEPAAAERAGRRKILQRCDRKGPGGRGNSPASPSRQNAAGRSSWQQAAAGGDDGPRRTASACRRAERTQGVAAGQVRRQQRHASVAAPPEHAAEAVPVRGNPSRDVFVEEKVDSGREKVTVASAAAASASFAADGVTARGASDAAVQLPCLPTRGSLSKREKDKLLKSFHRLRTSAGGLPRASLPNAISPERKAAIGDTAKARNSGAKLTKLQWEMQKKLRGSKFRWLNEQLYTTTGAEAFELFSKTPELFDVVSSCPVTAWA
ncbi:MAG: hypothetical protein BJ554DRAFT_4281, partial [Olpidium bornovanus]